MDRCKKKKRLIQNYNVIIALTTSISDGSNTKHSLGRLALLPVRFPKLKRKIKIKNLCSYKLLLNIHTYNKWGRYRIGIRIIIKHRSYKCKYIKKKNPGYIANIVYSVLRDTNIISTVFTKKKKIIHKKLKTF